jgi:hypothetical protein
MAQTRNVTFSLKVVICQAYMRNYMQYLCTNFLIFIYSQLLQYVSCYKSTDLYSTDLIISDIYLANKV